MSPTAFPPTDADLAGLLHRLQAVQATGDAGAIAPIVAAIGPARGHAAATRLAALALGGVDLAERLMTDDDGPAGSDERTGALLQAFADTFDAPAGASPNHERDVARQLVQDFDLDLRPEALTDVLRATVLVDRGPLAELPQAVMGALRHQQWALALRGLERVRQGLGGNTPRDTYGMAAMCLHRLGRFDEADAWVNEGLGDDRRKLAIPPVHTERELQRRWGKAAAVGKPVITILCTTYNHQRYIDSTIRGFLSQDCPYPFEILIHDDASTDGTQDVIRRWQRQYPALIKPVLQTVNQKSQGVHPFELLLARARGDYVATCEGDDYWVEPAKLARQVGFLMQHPDVSCSAHNYHHFIETSLTVRTWSRIGRDCFISQRQLMATQFLLWLPTLVFRKTFSALPPERALAAFGDQFLTSYLGTLGRCAYFDSLVGAVRRENEFSSWSPLPAREKERRRVKTWVAMLRLHQRLGNAQAVDDLTAKIDASTLDAAAKAALLAAAPLAEPVTDIPKAAA